MTVERISGYFHAGVRVAVACSDTKLLDRSATHLRELGAVARTCSTLAETTAAAERSDAVVFFADGFDDRAMLSNLDRLERWHSGPVLLVVTDRTPALWIPSAERARPAMLLSGSTWRAFLDVREPRRAEAGSAPVARGTPLSAAPAPESSQPELPFTD